MNRTLLCIIIVLMLIMVFIWPLSSSIGLGCFGMVMILIIISIIRNNNKNKKDMKIFRIVSELVYIEEYKDKSVSTVERYRIEQQYHFMWVFHYWKTPKFAVNELFAYPNIAEYFIWSYYPDAVIL